jgi:hypothetical protein
MNNRYPGAETHESAPLPREIQEVLDKYGVVMVSHAEGATFPMTENYDQTTGECLGGSLLWVELDCSSLAERYYPGWEQDVKEVVDSSDTSIQEMPVAPPQYTREDPSVTHVLRGRTPASVVQRRLPKLQAIYEGPLREIFGATYGEQAETFGNPSRQLFLNVQRGTANSAHDGKEMSFEAHVDSIIAGVLGLEESSGGELKISRLSEISVGHEIRGRDAIREDAVEFNPKPWHLYIFDGTTHPHFAEPITDPESTRVVAIPHYSTQKHPEEQTVAMSQYIQDVDRR